jgi:hypothetical protein
MISLPAATAMAIMATVLESMVSSQMLSLYLLAMIAHPLPAPSIIQRGPRFFRL